MNAGCIAGVHHHRISSTFEHEGDAGSASGQINSVDLGVVADFRYARLAFPFEGHRREFRLEGQSGNVFSINEVVEMRTLRVDVPLLSLWDLSSEPTGKRYPGSMKKRTGVELWVSGSVGAVPDHPFTATAGLVYYKYGGFAVRLFAGASMIPYDGVSRTIDADGGEHFRRRNGHVQGMLGGLEVTMAAGEYALELIQYILDFDKRSRDWTNDW